MEKLKITYDDVVSAIGKNGYSQITGNLTGKVWDDEAQKYTFGGCAMGQAAINLAVYPHSLEAACGTINSDGGLEIPREKIESICKHFGANPTFTAFVEHLNDQHTMPLNKIEEVLRKVLPKTRLKKQLRLDTKSHIDVDTYIRSIIG